MLREHEVGGSNPLAPTNKKADITKHAIVHTLCYSFDTGSLRSPKCLRHFANIEKVIKNVNWGKDGFRLAFRTSLGDLATLEVSKRHFA